MNDPLYFNGRLTTTAERVLGVEDRGLQFGDSVYEVLKFLERTPLFAEDHYGRMATGLDFLAIPNPWSTYDEFKATCRELLERTVVDDGLIYVQVTRGECERTHFYPEDLTPTAIAYTRAWKFPDAEMKAAGIDIVTGPDIRWDRCSVKSVNLLGNVIAKTMARSRGAKECLLVRDGIVTEGASSSFFGLVDKSIRTHPADEGILPGTVRDHVIAIARREGVKVDERSLATSDLERLGEAFITSTSNGVMPVRSIDGRTVGSGRRGPVTETLQTLFDALERDRAGISPD